jgi:hypothetical protein
MRYTAQTVVPKMFSFSPHILDSARLPTLAPEESRRLSYLRAEEISPLLANISRQEQATAFAFPSRLRTMSSDDVIDLALALNRGMDGEHARDLLRNWPDRGTIDKALILVGFENHPRQVSAIDFMRAVVLAQPPGKIDYDFPSDRQAQADLLKQHHYRASGITLRMMDACADPHSLWHRGDGELWDSLRTAAYGTKPSEDTSEISLRYPLKTRRLVDLTALNVLADIEHFNGLSIVFGNQPAGRGICEAYPPIVGDLFGAKFADSVQMEILPGAMIFYFSTNDYETVERLRLPKTEKSGGMLLGDINLKYDLGGRLIMLPRKTEPLSPYNEFELICPPEEREIYRARRHEIQHAIMWSHNDPERRSRIFPISRHLNDIKNRVEQDGLSFTEELNLHQTFALRIQIHQSDSARDETLAYLAGNGKLETHPQSQLGQWSSKVKLETIERHLGSARSNLSSSERGTIFEVYSEAIGASRTRVEEFQFLIGKLVDRGMPNRDSILLVEGLLQGTSIKNLGRIQERVGLGTGRVDLQALILEQKVAGLQDPLIALEDNCRRMLKRQSWPKPESSLLSDFNYNCSCVKALTDQLPLNPQLEELIQVVDTMTSLTLETSFNDQLEELEQQARRLSRCITETYGINKNGSLIQPQSLPAQSL